MIGTVIENRPTKRSQSAKSSVSKSHLSLSGVGHNALLQTVKVAFRHARFRTFRPFRRYVLMTAPLQKSRIDDTFYGCGGRRGFYSVFTGVCTPTLLQFAIFSKSKRKNNPEMISRGWGWGFSIIPRHEKKADSF